MFICRLHDKAGIRRKTLELERFSEYLTAPESQIRVRQISDSLFPVGDPMIRFHFSHIINKNAVNVECYYAEG